MVDTMHDFYGLQAAINQTLPDGWEAKITPSGRLYYLDHSSAKSQWLPPVECWPLKTCLPYGWEKATTTEGKTYFINHVTCITTTCHPYVLQVEEPAPTKRLVTLQRDSIHGFGFIAGSEGPVVVRSVTEEGPSWSKLLPGDQILQIDGEDVAHSRRVYIIEKIMGAADAVQLLVSQPSLHNDGVRSAMLSHNKKQKLMARPLRVRFADNIRTFTSNAHKVPASLSYLPNILKVYLENGQTKSFRYDSQTTVKSVLENISIKLGIEKPQHFALVTEDVRLSASQKFQVLSEELTLRQISSQPDSQHWRCLYRLTFPPKDAYELLLHDSSAFDYFYHQCRNDVICERFGSELKFDLALRLASLNIQQHLMHVNKKSVKVSVKMLQKQDGLELFLPKSILENHKKKELRKQICHHLKQNQTFTPPGQKCLTEVQAKLHYLKIIGELKTFACRQYHVSTVNTENVTEKSETLLQVSRKMGICRVLNEDDEVLECLAEFKDLEGMVLSSQAAAEGIVDAICQIEIIKTDGKKMLLEMPEKEGRDFANFVSGFYKVYVHNEKCLLTVDNSRFLEDPNSGVPPYSAEHQVVPAGWNYPDKAEYSEYLDPADDDMTEVIDLRIAPPSYDDMDQSGCDEPCSPVSKTGSLPETIQEDEESTSVDEEGNVACASSAVLPCAPDDDDTSSVISLTDMSFDIREKSDGNTNSTEEDRISQLLLIINEESKEKKKTVIEKLDGTAKLKRKRLSLDLDLRERKESSSSSDGRPSSFVPSCQSDFDMSDRSSAIEDIDLDFDNESSVSTASVSFDQEEDLPIKLGEGEEVDEDEIPVSVIDIPSPDSVTSPNQSMQFEYDVSGASPEANDDAHGSAVHGNSEEKQEGEKAEARVEEREEVQGEDVEETLESIAESFKTSEGVKSPNEDESILGGHHLNENVVDGNISDSGSLDTLVDSFRVDDDDGEVKTKPVINRDDSVKSQASEETIVGLVEALQEVTQHVDHNLMSKHDDKETFLLPDENGNSKSMVEMDQSNETGPEEESLSKADVSTSFNDSVRDDEKVMFAYVLDVELETPVDESGHDFPTASSDLVSGKVQEKLESLHSSSNTQLSVEALNSPVQSSVLKNEDHSEDTTQVKVDHPSPDGAKGGHHLQKTDSDRSDNAQEEAGDAAQILGKSGACCLPNDEKDSTVEGSNGQPQSLDEAHGIQLAALLALDASLSDKEEEIARVPMMRDDAESDSGNETIASECVDGPTGEQQHVFLEVSSTCEAEEEEPIGALSSSENLDAALPQTSAGARQVFIFGGKPDNSSQSEDVQIDSNTLTSMINVMLTSPEKELSLVSDNSARTYKIDSGEFKNHSEGPEKNLEGEKGRENEDLSQDERNVIDFFIASLTVQPPPGFEDSVSEDLLTIIPPPSIEDIDEVVLGDVIKPEAVSGNDDVAESSKPLSFSPQREETHNEKSVKLVDQPLSELGKLAKDEGNVDSGSSLAKPFSNPAVLKVTDARPTPPPRRKVPRHQSSGTSPTKTSGSFRSPEEDSPSKSVKKKKVKRSATFSGNKSEEDSELNVNSDSSSKKSSLGWNSPSKYPSVIGESLSRVFSPVKSWNSFKESIRLRSSKPRSRMNLKALWPEVSIGSDGTSRFDLKSKSMENIVSWPDDEETVFSVGSRKKENTKLTLQRSESLADSLQKRANSSPAAFGDFVHERGETVVLQTEFFRKAALGSPAPRRPPPPRPDHPPLSHQHTFNVENEGGASNFLASPLSSKEMGPNVVTPHGVKGRSRAFSSPVTGENEMSHEDVLAAIEAKEYSSLEAFGDAYMDIQMLCHILERTSNGGDTSIESDEFDSCKEQLMEEIREFTNNSKVLVTSINYPVEQLLGAINECMHSLGRIIQRAQNIVTCLHSVLIASRLIHKVCDVADHFTTMLQMSIDARGKAFNSSTVQGVLRQAQTMAVLLSSLMRSIRMMQNLEPSCAKVP